MTGLLLMACATTPEPEVFARAADGLKAQTEARSGDLTLTCEPQDSEVWLDGVPVGSCAELSGRRGLSLGSRMRKVEVRREGFRPFETYVEPDGVRATLTVTLAPISTGGRP
ncbi:MAG: hypothetical protein JNK82_02510 [Myxococcaceae bacterium]|nr:hypothetical protein [Myxococcaceae bacterium]